MSKFCKFTGLQKEYELSYFTYNIYYFVNILSYFLYINMYLTFIAYNSVVCIVETRHVYRLLILGFAQRISYINLP